MNMKAFLLRKTKNEKRKTVLISLLLGLWLALSFTCPALSQETIESQGLKFCRIPGGYYLLGSAVSEPGRYADEDTAPSRPGGDLLYVGHRDHQRPIRPVSQGHRA